MREEALSFSDSGFRQAAVRAVINGSLIAGVVRADVTSSNYYGADCFKAELVVGAAPLSAPAFWGETLGIEADVQFSLDGINYTSLIVGQIDNIRLDPLVGRVIMTGRDFTATFIEAAVEESFLNRTASEVVEMLAGDAGFACVATPTTTPIGRYYENTYGISGLDQFSQFTTQWDLLVYLARQEGFDLFFSGRTLNFQPSGLSTYTAVVSPGDCTTLRLDRSLVLSRDIELTIRSWNSRQQSAYTQLFIGAAAGDGTGQPIRYKMTHPNLTPEQITSLGFRRIAELASYERCVELEMPGELTLTPRDLLAVAGTGTQFDQAYRIQSIQRCIDSRSGFKEVIRAVSATPRSVTITGAIPG